MESKREKMREWRRQADPSFPAAVKPRPSKPPPPRPSEPPPSRPTESLASRPIESSASRPSEPHPSRTPEPVPSKPGHGVLKGHKGRNKRKNKKGLRVSFDLENTQERVVPKVAEEGVAECWEGLSEGDGVSVAGPLSCGNLSKDDHGDSAGVGDEMEQLIEKPDALEGVTYFGIRESWDEVTMERISEARGLQESCQEEMVQDLSHVGVVTSMLKGVVFTDMGLPKELAFADTNSSEAACSKGPVEIEIEKDLLEILTDVSHPDEIDEVSRPEGLPEVSHPDELRYVSYEPLDVSHDGLNHTGLAPLRKAEEPSRVEYLEEINDRNYVRGETGLSSEDLTDESRLERLTIVTVPEADELPDVSHLDKFTNSNQASELTDISYLEGVTDRNDSKEVTNVSHLEGLTDFSHSGEPIVMNNFELPGTSNSGEIISVVGQFELNNESHSEVTDVNYPERLNGISYLEEPTEMRKHEEITELSLVDKERNIYDEMKYSEEQSDLNTLTGTSHSEEVNSGCGQDELTDIYPDKSVDPSHDVVTDKVLIGQQEDEELVLSDVGETLVAERKEFTSSFIGGLEADNSSDEPANALTCVVKEHTALPPAPDTEDSLEGTPDDDDDEWETELSGEGEETSENTCEGSITGEQRSPFNGRKDSDSLVLNDGIEAVLLALIEDQEKVMPPVVPSDDQPQEENHLLAPDAPLGEEQKASEREMSPQVTVGYECRDRKPTSVYGSETESEGELVPCEDKCVGTADQIDDSPLDLSTRENVMHEEGDSQNKVVECQERELSLDTNKQYTLAAPKLQVGGSSSSPEIPEIPEEGKCVGSSESGKEKDKINGKKAGKKKGKKNKREVKAEPIVIPVDVAERPKLVRGRAWKEKRQKINAKRVGLLNLSFGSELCVSEVVEGTSNLLTETYTETSILTPTRCPLGTTVFTETPCTACSSVSGEFSESDSLHADCKCGEQRREDAGVVALVAEVKTCDDAPESVSESAPKPAPELTPESVPELRLEHAPECTQEPAPELTLELTSNLVSEPTSEPGYNLAPSAVTVQVTRASDEEDNRAFSPTGFTDEFFIVRTRTVAAPSQVLTEYVEDTESEEDAKFSIEKVDSKPESSFTFQALTDRTFESPKSSENSRNMTEKNEDSIYIDADGSGCTDTINMPFDYEKSFPKVLGTQQLNLIYSYDSSPDTDSESGEGSVEDERQTPNSEGSPFLIHSSEAEVNTDRNGDGDAIYTSGWGEIIYEGPCLCGDTEIAREPRIKTEVIECVSTAARAGAEEQLCVPVVHVSDAADVAAGESNKECEGATGSEPPTLAMGSNQEDQGSEDVGSAKDIRLRINEIVGGRLQRDRGRIVSPGMREEGGCLEEHHGGREDSPLPGSSPASSSGVQGSDEMSLSRSRSRSPSREESVSPACTPHELPECSQEPRPSHLLAQERYEREALESLRALRFDIDSTPEKSSPVDCSFRTFRDMYQINPIYLTDSDDHDDLNESDTVVPVSTSIDYDPERSITVTSWSSTSDCSPDPPELTPSPPLPGTHTTKKVPKVTKLLRETQGIVQRWEVLQAQAVERQRQSSQVRELQRQVKNLRLSLEALGEQASKLTKADDIDNRLKLIQKLQAAKALQEEVSARKTEVSGINLAVHRFLTETGYSLASLKDDVADLYRLWDEADRRVSSELSRLENVDTTWKLWEMQAEELTKMLRQDEDTLRVLDVAIQTGSMTDSNTESMKGVARLLNDRRKTQPGKKLLLQHTKTQSIDIQGSSLSLAASGDECLSDSGTSGYESCSSEELSERERRLANLRRLARDLEASLHPNSQAWATICKTLFSAEAELKGLQQHCRELVVRSSETLDQAKTSPQQRRRMWSKDCKVSKAGRRTNSVSGSGRNGGRRGWVWRVVRAALPFQAALLLLFCVACLLEPNCCDHVNTLNLSLSPQLRYVHGPPPV